MHRIAPTGLEEGLDADLRDAWADGIRELREELEKGGRALNAQLEVVEEWECFLVDFLVDGEQADAVLRALGVLLGEDVFVAAFAFDRDRVVRDAAGSEVVAVDLRASLLWQLHEREGFGWLDDDGLVSLPLALLDILICGSSC